MHTENWMKNIADETLLSMINIPGTHDSAARFVTAPTPQIFCCQDMSVKKQLLSGARFLDIRLVLSHKKFKAVHYIMRCRKNKELSGGTLLFDDILRDTAEFLKENPTETVIVSVKMDFGVNVRDFYQSFVHRYIEPQKELWYTENKIPSLGAVRGKIVLMRRCMLGTNDLSSVDNGLDFSYWEDQKGTDNPLPLPCWFGNEENEKAIIQDRYALTKEEKWRSAVTTMLGDYRPHKNIMALNFLSTRGNPRENADYINKKFSEYPLPDKPLGIIIFDFLTEALAEKVINTNTEAKK
ncbi:MAG TPA: hypothetical protein DCQ76_03845 [Ruminococcaceae bacterium]|nr:hypothetical protein [Oscillospiraceae bacterium]